MRAKLKTFLASKRFLHGAVLLFILQAVFFAIVIPYKVPSDEEYHFRFTNYYAQRSVLAGPIIADQNDNFDLGDIQRTPGYLYHYLSSYLLRVVKVVAHSEKVQVVVLRIVNVGLGGLALWLLIGLLRRIGGQGITINLTVAWLALTTMFVWVFSALSYDDLAMVLFFVLLHLLLDLYAKITVNRLLASIAVVFALMLTKETYLPTVLLCFLLLFVGWLKKYSFIGIWSKLGDSWQQSIKHPKTRYLLILTTLAVLLFGGLCIERYGRNYLLYKKTTPTCNQVHSEAECLQNSIYRRNTGQKREYEVYKQGGGKPDMTYTQYTVKWVRFIYERTYFFRGHGSTDPSWQARVVAVITAPVLVLLVIAGWRRQKYTATDRALLLITSTYIILVFLYNLNSYIYYGYPFAIQGRYILPVLPFLYFYIVRAMQGAYRSLPARGKTTMLLLLIALVIANLPVHFPLSIYKQKSYQLVPPVSVIATHLS